MRPLVIRYRKLGDSLMVTPLLRALAERGDVFAVGETAFERVFTGVPGVSGFTCISRGEPTRLELFRVGLAARRFRCDTAFILRFSRRSAIIARLAGCRVRAGGSRSGSRLLAGVNVRVEIPDALHQVEKYYTVAEAVTGPLPKYPTFYPAPSADGLPPPYAVVHVGNGGSNLDWSDDRFAHVVHGLQKAGSTVVVTGDRGSANPETRAAADRDLVGATDLDRLAGVFKGADLVVGLDGGGPRIAAAVGTPVVVLAIGSRWSAHQVAPWMSPGVVVEPQRRCDGCRPGFCNKQGRACIETLTPDEVLNAARTLLAAEPKQEVR